MDSYRGQIKIPDGKGLSSATIKRCMPVFDSIEAGYILVSHADIYVSQKNNIPHYEWPSGNPLEFHHISQAPTLPINKVHTHNIPKWMNPWSIETPKGYSTLIVQPFHRESAFTILPGIVDTDTYTAPINFPFVLNEIDFQGLLPAGTPIAQVIPFKRENWKMVFGGQKDAIKSQSVVQLLRSKIFDSYKSQFRQSKQYK